MTVSDLIKALVNMPQSADVVIDDDGRLKPATSVLIVEYRTAKYISIEKPNAVLID